MTDTKLKDKVVLVTGANHGVGAATAKAFAAQGAKVFINYLSNYLRLDDIEEAADTKTPGYAFYRLQQAKSADEVMRTIRTHGGRAEAWEADLADPDNIPQLFDRAEADLGPVDVLVNNAAFCLGDTFLPQKSAAQGDRSLGGLGTEMSTLTAKSHDQHFAVNSRATALMMAEYARRHIKRRAGWGRIINVSTDGAAAFPGDISYGASKHALESYSRAAAKELGPHGVTVNIVSLGAVQTGWISPELQEKEERSYPLRRIGQPEDVADVILFFASEQARWITGQLLYVGGGHVMPL